VKFLSQWDLRLAGILLIAMLIIGPTVFLLDSFIQNTGYYLQSLLELGFWTTAYADSNWQDGWSIFYWAWWISWSPFVGMFIARVSRGRTVREFFLGVLIVPSLLTFLWMTVFGGSALHLEMNGLGSIPVEAAGDVPRALFAMFDQYPFSLVTSTIAVILVMVFFVTSSDSGSLVVDSITSGGALDAPRGQRIFWASMEGAIAAALLISGGLAALQTAAIVTGLPFAILLMIMCFSLYKGLNKEYHELRHHELLKERESYRTTIAEIISKRLGKGKGPGEQQDEQKHKDQ
jgi:choline/glycine/proline betaine transport protein